MSLGEFFGLAVPDAGPLFFAALAVHVLGAVTALISGAVAAIARKGPGIHPRAGRVYVPAICAVAASATVMAIVQWEHSAYLLLLAGALLGLLALGWVFRPSRRQYRPLWHAIGMGGSYIVLFTGFYVDNGAEIPVWELFHPLVYWLLPAIVGIPLVALGLWRYQRARGRAAGGRRPLGRARSSA